MKKILSTLLLSVFATCSFANTGLQNKLKTTFPKLNIQSIESIGVGGLYEVSIIGAENSLLLAYTNQNGDFLISGNAVTVIDTKNKKDIVYERSLKKSVELFKQLPFQHAITKKYGNGNRKVAIFTDPDCPYCQKVESDIHANGLTDTTIYYFLMPLESLHPEAKLKAKKIMCASNPAKALNDWFINSQLPNNNGSCAKGKSVDESINLGNRFNLQGVPAFMFDNGILERKTLSSKRIMEILNTKSP